MKLKLPNNKKFIFTIIDDTDDCFYEKIEPVYDLINKSGLKTTKTVWVYPVKDHERSKGHSLRDEHYRNFIIELKNNGFEIGLHNVGSGDYKRKDIINGLNEFKKILGEYPKIHVNHSYNKDNIYCGPKRFSFPFNFLVKFFYSGYKNFSGEIVGSPFFWADKHKKYIKYSRNYEIDNINTLKVNPYMPYRDLKYQKYCNSWYSSTFAPNQWIFNKIVTKKSIDRLENEGGVCILYTHLGYFNKNNVINEGFRNMISYIGQKKTGLFIPVSETLDILSDNKVLYNIPDYLPPLFKFKLEYKSLMTRIKYRYFNKIDDYHFKKSDIYREKIG